MKTENIIHLALGVGILGLAAYSISKINKQGKEIAQLKEQAAKTNKLGGVVKEVKDVVDQVVNRTMKAKS